MSRNILLILIGILTISQVCLGQRKPFPSPQSIKYLGTENDVIQVSGLNYRFLNESFSNRVNLQEYKDMIDFYEDLMEKHLSSNGGSVLDVLISLEKIDQPFDYVSTDIDESYRILINEQKEIRLECKNYVSFLRALNVFSQIIQEGRITHYPIIVEDKPSYQHRGLMIDTSRTFLLVSNIQGLLKGMQKTALNVLHWHVTDSESFPIQLINYSEIPSYGAYSSSEVYSINQIASLIREAQQRGIIIIPEIDSPGHARSWALAPNLQEINACYGYPPQDWAKYCAEPPCGQLDPTLNKTYEVVKSVLSQIDSYFTSSYFHFGGDEVNSGCWDYRPSIKQWMQQNKVDNYSQLQNIYMNKVVEFVSSKKTPIFWFQADQANATYPTQSIIQFWAESTQYDLLKKFSNKVILSPVDYLYFDCGAGNQLGESSWCDPWKTWKKVYNLNLTATGVKDRILGAEITLWSEMISPKTFDWRVWPRSSALALRLWNENENLAITELVQTLQYNINQLYELGLRPGPITVEYCHKYIGRCFFDDTTEQIQITEA